MSCTYEPISGQVVEFGESSTEEMCFLGVLYHPGDTPLCVF